MDKEYRKLIEQIVENDLESAKKTIWNILDKNNDEDNRAFVEEIKNRLNSTNQHFLEVPSSIDGMFIMEDVSASFNEQRFVITGEDAEVVNQIIDIYNTNATLKKYGIQYLNSLLFYGVSGCGKTLLGKYIAYKAGIPFGYLNFTRLLSCYLGQTGRNIAQIFNYVKNHKCVLMLDEIDAIGLSRGVKNDVGELNRICINLMQQLDLFDSGNILIGATNRVEDIDEALKRRFSIKHEIKLPSADTRKAIAQKYLDTIPGSQYTEDSLRRFADDTKDESCAIITNRIINGIVQCLVRQRRINLEYI
jgi:SpoVK/Ycf46/Vps4 family AAA+-type ATPase